ncbi:DUF3168 domain-containing protein [Mesorhizobium sp.]|uniref:DUF3168 domain-containing protein n=2 Tax=Mesorhizobium TaxID=68287 RepID=UPI0025F528AE|nr:DUF3168 domain-containing protein [Mesorhizobium sp.]
MPADDGVGKVALSRSSASIIPMTNRHRLRASNGYICQNTQNADSFRKAIIGSAGTGGKTMTAPDDLQQALFLRLKSDASLSALLGGAGLLERPTDNAAFPYVTCGQTSAFDWDTSTENTDDQLITLHVWSKAHGDAETLAIMAAIQARLADAALVIGPRGQTRLSLEFAEARPDEDLLVHHGLLRFRAITQENA